VKEAKGTQTKRGRGEDGEGEPSVQRGAERNRQLGGGG